jgi:hypothetical protein
MQSQVTLGISAGAKFFSFFVIEYRTTYYLSLDSVIKKESLGQSSRNQRLLGSWNNRYSNSQKEGK